MHKILKKVWQLLSSREKLITVGIFAMMLVSSALELLGIGLVMPIIALLSKPKLIEQNKYLRTIYDILSPESHKEFLVILCIALIILYLGKNLFLAFQNYFQSKFIMHKGAELANTLFSNYVRAPYKYHLINNSGTLLGKINMADALSMNLLIPFMIAVTEAMVVTIIFLALLILSPLITIGLIVAIAIITAITYISLRNVNGKLGLRYKNEQLAMNKYALQGIKAIKESKVRNAETFFAREYAVHRIANNEASANMIFLNNLPRFLVEGMIVSLGLGVLLMLVLSNMPVGSIVLTLSLFAASAIRIMPSLTRIQYSLTRIKQFSHSFNAVFDDIVEFEVEKKTSASAPIIFKKKILIDNVSFGYDGADRDVFNEFTMVIDKNSSVAFVGPTGCGKTTLVDIILGLLKPRQGTVKVDGVDIEKDLINWQKMIGYVPQFIFLLDDTIKANVAFGEIPEKIDDDRVERCLKMAQVYDFVKSLSHGIDNVIGENGIQLSGGQRQRIGIARALYHDPQVLILDEATSALDNDTEKAFIDALYNLHGKLTIIMIAHRLTTVENCDKVIEL